jgi:hypothetical protein
LKIYFSASDCCFYSAIILSLSAFALQQLHILQQGYCT